MQNLPDTTETHSLVDDAILEVETLLQELRIGAESLRPLEDPLRLANSHDAPVPQDGPENPFWEMGIMGHGIQSLQFYCHWESRRLTFTFLLPFERILTPVGLYHEHRNIFTGCCFLILALLQTEKEGIEYAPNEPDAALRVKCDIDLFQYLIHKGENVIRQGKDWTDLEPLLDEQQRVDLAATSDLLMIFRP